MASELLSVDSENIEYAIEKMLESFLLANEEMQQKQFVFLPEYYNAEKYIAARLCAVKDQIPNVLPMDELEIDAVENKLNLQFDARQRSAIRAAVDNGLLILTGGPGTGKSATRFTVKQTKR